MNKLSYMILHFNRPFLLEPNIRLVRKYAPAGTEIVVADDGSDPEVIEAIRKMPIDNIYVQKAKNKNTTTIGTCSNTINSGRSICTGDYFLFSEDDFFLSGAPIKNWEYLKNEEVMPRVSFLQGKHSILEKSMHLLESHPAIKNVQLGRDPLRVPVDTSFEFDGLKWYYGDHSQKGGCYYCNWPNMSRLDDHKKFLIPKGLAIWSLEGKMAGGFDEVFGDSDWAVVPPSRYYWHVGTAFSKRLNSFSKSAKRQVSAKKVQDIAFGEGKARDLESFNAMMLEAWKKGHFRIDFDQLIAEGLNPAFTDAFARFRTFLEK